MRQTTRWMIIALYLNAALLAAMLMILLSRNNAPGILPAAFGQHQPPIGGGAGVFIVPAQFSSNAFGCYLMDIDAQTLCVYQFFPADRQLRLVAARNFRWDRRLGNFNTEKPTPEEVRQLVEQQQQSGRVLERNVERPPVEVEAPSQQ